MLHIDTHTCTHLVCRGLRADPALDTCRFDPHIVSFVLYVHCSHVIVTFVTSDTSSSTSRIRFDEQSHGYQVASVIQAQRTHCVHIRSVASASTRRTLHSGHHLIHVIIPYLVVVTDLITTLVINIIPLQ